MELCGLLAGGEDGFNEVEQPCWYGALYEMRTVESNTYGV